MRTVARPAVLLGLCVLGLGTGARAHSAFWPIKTVDLTNDGADCDTSTQQYLKLEGNDYHDHPKFTLRWRQMTGACGEEVDGADLVSFEASYDGSTDYAEDDPPTEGNQGRVQLNLYVCSPFGEYEIDLDIESYSDESDAIFDYPPSTSWTIWNGPDEYELWRTVYSGSAKDESRLSPKVPGKYTWPLEIAMGYYGILIAGPVPPLECESSMRASYFLVGCFADSKTDRLLNSHALDIATRGPDGMTAKICSEFCGGYDYFGLEYGNQCFCGSAEEFEGNAVASDECGVSIEHLCSGDPTTACGGYDAIHVYKRKKYSVQGCFEDYKESRIMDFKGWAGDMSAEICNGQCSGGNNTHFGTQHGNECWCAVDADLTKNGEVLEMDVCGMLCAGTTSGEYCGGKDKITAYQIEQPVPSKYVGCYEDQLVRAMDAEGIHITEDMTNEVCMAYCGDKGHTYAGTQYGNECWCGEDYDLYGEISHTMCSYRCEGDAHKHCGGDYALSVWSTE